MFRSQSWRVACCLAVLNLQLAPLSVLALDSESTSRQTNWQKVDEAFTDDYKFRREEIKRALGPVIVLGLPEAVLIKNGEHSSVPCVPESYTARKTVDHIALAIYVILLNQTGKPLNENACNQLKLLAERVEKAQTFGRIVDQLSDSDSARQQKIISDSLQFLGETLRTGQVSSDQLHAFVQSIAPASMQNADDAIASQLGLLDEIVTGWRQQMTEDEWARTYVIVSGEHMPRDRNSAMQYALALMKQPAEGDRVVYYEGEYDESKALDLLATHILDRHIAIDYFADKMRMHRDLLSDGARKYLDKHKPGESQAVRP